MKYVRAVVSVLILAGSLQSVSAFDFQKENLQWETSVGGVGEFDTDVDGSIGKIHSTLKDGKSIHIAAYYRLQDWAQVGAETFYMWGLKPKKLDLPDIDGDGRRDSFDVSSSDDERTILFVGPALRLGMPITGFQKLSGKKSLIYVVGGAGLYRSHDSGGAVRISGRSSNGTAVPAGTSIDAPSDSSTDAGVNVGVGGDYPIFPHLGGGFDIRYHRINSDDAVHFVIIALRLSYIF